MVQNQVFSVVKDELSHPKDSGRWTVQVLVGRGGVQLRKPAPLFLKQLHILTNHPDRSPFPTAKGRRREHSEHHRTLQKPFMEKSMAVVFLCLGEMAIIQVLIL